jgi:hypothetical protein
MQAFRHRRGQAMTELLIAASFVLVPLFLLIPLLGKYIDIRHAAIQAARYEAWEYTVWYNGTAGGAGDDRPGGYPNALPIKTLDETDQESMRRFFSRTDLPISGDDIAGWDEADRNPLWTDHRGNFLWDGTLDSPTLTDQNESTPDLTFGVMSAIVDIIDTIFEALASALGLIGDVGFTAINTNGYSISTVEAIVNVPDGLIDFQNMRDAAVDDSVGGFQLAFRSQAAVLTDNWNAGGLEHTTNQAGGLVPTKILAELIEAIPGLKDIWDVVTTFLAPELRLCNPSFPHPFGDTWDKAFVEPQDGSLWLGYMDIDAVPADRLDMDEDGARDDARAVTCDAGVCRYDFSGATYSGPTPYTQGMSKSICDT